MEHLATVLNSWVAGMTNYLTHNQSADLLLGMNAVVWSLMFVVRRELRRTVPIEVHRDR